MSTTTKEVPTLNATVREGSGSQNARGLRAEEKVPAQIYGQGKENQELALVAHELELCLRSNPTLVKLNVAGKEQPALIKEIQRDTFGSGVIHVDFQRVELDQPVDVNVPIEFFGTPQGAELGSRLEIQRNTIRLRVRADSIPASIRIMVGEIEVGTRLTFGKVTLPANAALLSPAHASLCQVSQSKRAAAAKKEEKAPAGKKAAAPVKAAAPAKAAGPAKK